MRDAIHCTNPVTALVSARLRCFAEVVCASVFFKSANRDRMRERYSKHLGLADKARGQCCRGANATSRKRNTLWFGLFSPPPRPIPVPAPPRMVNYIVDNLDALNAKQMNEAYGRFAWIYDLDGNKIELWQPPPARP